MQRFSKEWWTSDLVNRIINKIQRKMYTYNKLGGWSIDQEVIDRIDELLVEGQTILELGSGYGTHILSGKYKMISIEENSEWSGKYNSTYIHAPINGGWYDLNIVKDGLDGLEYDLILVDGPEGKFTEARHGFFNNIDLFNIDVPIVFDDTNRSGEKQLLEMFMGRYPQRQFQTFDKFTVVYGIKE